MTLLLLWKSVVNFQLHLVKLINKLFNRFLYISKALLVRVSSTMLSLSCIFRLLLMQIRLFVLIQEAPLLIFAFSWALLLFTRNQRSNKMSSNLLLNHNTLVFTVFSIDFKDFYLMFYIGCSVLKVFTVFWKFLESIQNNYTN